MGQSYAPVKLGLIGCGDVSGQYVDQCRMFPQVEVLACAARDVAAAKRHAEKYEIPKASSPDELLGDPEVEIVLNLTPPGAHVEVTLAAIAAGKHVFTEKPLAPTLDEAEQLIAAAREAGVALGCAPAGFMSGPFQTARKLVDDGWIGDPVAATSFFTNHGYEHWHPNIDPYYEPGGGPMLDIGPYLTTVLVSLFGPATRVGALAKRVSDTRRRPSASPGEGDIRVQVDTHVTGGIDFASGPVATVITSWEMWATRLPFIEVYGTEGTLSVPYDDVYGGQPMVRRGEPGDLTPVPTPPGGGNWREVGLTHSTETGRAVAVADMADAIRTGRQFRANHEFAYHLLEIMLAFEESSRRGEHVELKSSCEQPPALPPVAAGEPVRF